VATGFASPWRLISGGSDARCDMREQSSFLLGVLGVTAASVTVHSRPLSFTIVTPSRTIARAFSSVSHDWHWGMEKHTVLPERSVVPAVTLERSVEAMA
jgi:hypothetical protein